MTTELDSLPVTLVERIVQRCEVSMVMSRLGHWPRYDRFCLDAAKVGWTGCLGCASSLKSKAAYCITVRSGCVAVVPSIEDAYRITVGATVGMLSIRCHRSMQSGRLACHYLGLL